jgi:hypothetical protein
MSRAQGPLYRTVPHGWTSDPRICRLTDRAFRCYWTIVTGPHVTRLAGLVRIGPGQLADLMRLSLQQAQDALAEVQTAGLLTFDPVAQVAHIPGAVRVQPPTNPDHVTALAREFDSFPPCPPRDAYWSELRELLARRGARWKRDPVETFLAALELVDPTLLAACGTACTTPSPTPCGTPERNGEERNGPGENGRRRLRAPVASPPREARPVALASAKQLAMLKQMAHECGLELEQVCRKESRPWPVRRDDVTWLMDYLKAQPRLGTEDLEDHLRREQLDRIWSELPDLLGDPEAFARAIAHVGNPRLRHGLLTRAGDRLNDLAQKQGDNLLNVQARLGLIGAIQPRDLVQLVPAIVQTSAQPAAAGAGPS